MTATPRPSTWVVLELTDPDNFTWLYTGHVEVPAGSHADTAIRTHLDQLEHPPGEGTVYAAIPADVWNPRAVYLEPQPPKIKLTSASAEP